MTPKSHQSLVGIPGTPLTAYMNMEWDLDIEELQVEPLVGGRSNPTFLLTDDSRKWVLRRSPLGQVSEGSHDMGREYAFMNALSRSEVPVPTVVGLCKDAAVIGAPFYVMEWLDGTTIRTADDADRVDPFQRGDLGIGVVGVLARLHGIEPEGVGLSGWGRPEGYLERQVRRWERSWDGCRTNGRPGVHGLAQRLLETMPTNGPVGIVHGDFKLDNLLLDREKPSRILAVLDWELATIGDSLTDLGLLLSFWDEPDEEPHPLTAGTTAIAGFPRRDWLIEHYATLVGLGDIDATWYTAFADFKIAVIFEQLVARERSVGLGAELSELQPMVGWVLQRAADRLKTHLDGE